MADGGNQIMVEVGAGVSVAGSGVLVARNASMAEHEDSSPARRVENKNRLKIMGVL